MKKFISAFFIILCILSTVTGTFAFDIGEYAIGGPVVKDQYLAWTGTDNRINIASIAQASSMIYNWKITLDETSNFKPALLISKNEIYVFWTGLDGKINYNCCDESFASSKTKWNNKVTLDDTSIAAPAVSSMLWEQKYGFYTSCHALLCWTGTDNRINTREFYRSDFDYDKMYALYMGKKVTLNEKSLYEPSVLESIDSETNHYYTLAWTGTDRRLNYMISRDNNDFKDGDSKITSDYIEGAPSIYYWRTNKMFLGYSMTNKNLKHVIINFNTGKVESYHNYSQRKSNHAPAYIFDGDRNFIWADTNGSLNNLRVIE